MVVSHNREKLLNLIIYFVKNTKRCFKTKLFKLLYFSDFIHFRETGKSITGLVYRAWEKGPVPTELFHELKNPRQDLKEAVGIIVDEKKTEFIPKKKFDDKYFTDRELKIIENVAYIFKEADTDLAIESTHLRNSPWRKTIATKKMGADIDYNLAFDDSKETLPSDRRDELAEYEKFLEEFLR